MKIYKVGGYVRDKLLGLPPRDCDYVVIGSTPQEMLKQGFLQVGRDFPVFLHPQTKEEYALARSERKVGHGHIGFITDSSPTITLVEDLSRRDLTINAIAEDDTGNIIDPYNGQRDLELKLLRHVSPAFSDDPLRILRVARFAAQLDFTVADETMLLLQKMAKTKEGMTISRERVVSELDKTLDYQNCANFFQVLDHSGNLSIFFPLLSQSIVANLNRFIAALNCASSKNERWLIIALYLTNVDAINELTLHKFHRQQLLNATRINSLLMLGSPPPAKELLDFYQKLDIWRNYDNFVKLGEIFARYLSRQNYNYLTKLNQYLVLAKKLKELPLADIANSANPTNIEQIIRNVKTTTITDFLLNYSNKT